MKVKKSINIWLICLLFSLLGCNDMLDLSPLDRFENDATFWNNSSNVEGITNSFYNSFVGYGNNGGYGLYYFKTISDDQIGNPYTEWEYTTTPATSTIWDNGWEQIRLANIIIANVSKSTLSDAHKTRFLSIARLMRAWHYYNMVRCYGDLQWVDTPLTIADTSILYGERISRDIVMDNVLNDLNYASNNMPISASKISWSRNMANAMKADISLWEGTFRKYRTEAENGIAPDSQGSKRYLNACLDACLYILSQDFSLNDSYQGNYNSIDLSNNPEMIFYKQYKQGILSHSLIAYTSSSTTQSGMTKDAFDSYLFLDGKPLSLTSLHSCDTGSISSNGKNINISSLLAVRDKRLSATIDSILCYKGNTWARTPNGMLMTSTTGYTCSKYDNTSIPINYRNQTATNYTCAPIYWLSVVYLNYAEAKAELGTITQADLDNSINRLNARAELPPLNVIPNFSDTANNHNVSDLLWEIRRARRCELMFDNNYRYWDLVRWHQLDKLDSSHYPNLTLGANIQNEPSSQVEVMNGYIYVPQATRTYYPRYYLYPIPSSQLTLNPKLTQNPMW